MIDCNEITYNKCRNCQDAHCYYAIGGSLTIACKLSGKTKLFNRCYECEVEYK